MAWVTSPSRFVSRWRPLLSIQNTEVHIESYTKSSSFNLAAVKAWLSAIAQAQCISLKQTVQIARYQ